MGWGVRGGVEGERNRENVGKSVSCLMLVENEMEGAAENVLL